MSLPSLKYTLLRSDRRKTLALQVKAGEIIVRAPHYVKQHIITDLIKDKSVWLQQKIAEQFEHKVDCCRFIHGSSIYLAGKEIQLHVTFDTKAEVLFFDGELTVVISFRRNAEISKQINASQKQAQQVKKQLEQWLKQRCQNYLDHSLPLLIKQTTLKPSSVKIRQYQARWGSCNSKKELSFNYLLMMVPNWVVDYVIVHELCHLQHLNHSARFWLLVQQYYPNIKLAKTWLKTHQAQLRWHLP